MPVIVNSVTCGTILEHSVSSVPPGFLACDGSVVSTATYPSLFSQIGTTFNIGGEVGGTFRLPDMRGKSPIGTGQDSGHSLTNRIIGTYLGEENHTLTTAEILGHTHAATSATETQGHTHSATTTNFDMNHTHPYVRIFGSTGTDGSSNSNTSINSFQIAATGGPSASLHHSHSAPVSAAEPQTHTHTLTTDNGAVSGLSHANIQPVLVVQFIIKT